MLFGLLLTANPRAADSINKELIMNRALKEVPKPFPGSGPRGGALNGHIYKAVSHGVSLVEAKVAEVTRSVPGQNPTLSRTCLPLPGPSRVTVFPPSLLSLEPTRHHD